MPATGQLGTGSGEEQRSLLKGQAEPGRESAPTCIRNLAPKHHHLCHEHNLSGSWLEMKQSLNFCLERETGIVAEVILDSLLCGIAREQTGAASHPRGGRIVVADNKLPVHGCVGLS